MKGLWLCIPMQLSDFLRNGIAVQDLGNHLPKCDPIPIANSNLITCLFGEMK